MPRPLRLLVPLLSAALLALAMVPLSAGPASARPTVVGVAVDDQGKPLEGVYWDIYSLQGGRWTGLQFGPKLTDANGRFSFTGGDVGLNIGTKYRICFSDTFYGFGDGGEWTPDVRHRDTCWRSDATVSTSVETASDWTATDGPTTFTLTLPTVGLGMAPVEPFVVGAYEVGKPLTAVGLEGWRPTTANRTYQWYRWATNTTLEKIAGATASTYTPTSADAGKRVMVDVTGTLAGYKTAVLRSEGNIVGSAHAQLSSALKLTGTAAPGQTLTASFGPPAGSYYSEISWYVDGVPQVGFTRSSTTSATFPVTAAMAGANVEARVMVYLNDGGGNFIDGSRMDGRAVRQVQGVRPPQPLPLKAQPTVATTPVSGATAVGATLTAPSGLTADPAATTTYQWLRGGAPVPGATTSSYQLQPADVGSRISVAATVARPGWWSGFLRTSATSEVVQGVLPAGQVKVKGGAKVGAKLKAKVTGWDGVTLSYRWFRNGEAIKPAKAAAKASYKPTAKDRGKRITVVVTATKASYLPATVTSKAKRVKR
ncbi:hypothetical protein KVF89_16270 [Nocardioides carbamazepini]|uniref:hypothetical protein n=1 Tax=Nocardioides carbamazepini TaxID=2854259 RepID=UPI00214A5F9F|nr:hypothetical protein [Nocardioides carbamazepini]MCR1784097.1 hypothetical protein [Nocardioides carbamazepini]